MKYTILPKPFVWQYLMPNMIEDFNIENRMSNFPRGCCDDASDLLAYYLLEKYNIHTEQGNGVYCDDNPEHTTNHAWLIVNGESYIDITATQFMFCGAFK